MAAVPIVGALAVPAVPSHTHDPAPVVHALDMSSTAYAVLDLHSLGRLDRANLAVFAESRITAAL